MVTAVRTRRPLPVRLKSGSAQVIYSEHLHDFRSQWLQHDFDKFVIIDGGSGIIEISGRQTVTVHTGDAVYIPSTLTHRWFDNTGDALRLVVICFDQARLPNDLQSSLGADLIHIANNNLRIQARHLCLAQNCVQEQLEQGCAWQSQIMVQVQTLLLQYLRQSALQVADELVSAVQSYIHQHHHELINIEQLAREYAVSYRSLTQRFKQATGKSINVYQRGERIQTACALLQSGVPICDVALRLGFSDTSNFYKAFKQELHCTPKQWLVQA